ncbi:MAG: hypothetical protein NWR42_08510, partial [Desulfobacterales bacterium]|nr:hypothetical protein [Desulfobacterales bacterium]
VVGFPLFGALAVIGFESLASFLLPAAVRNDPQMLPAAFERSRIAADRILLALFVFLILTALPPLFWQVRFSVWIDG